MFKKIIALLLAAAALFSLCACTKEPATGGPEQPPAADAQKEVNAALGALDDVQFTLAQLSGVDGQDRLVTPTVGMNGKYVGIFYFVANGYHTDKIYDISKLLERYPGRTIDTSPVTALSTGPTSAYYDASLSPEQGTHYWGEPLYGYYCGTDPWVVRKHLELFAYAGIDFLYLDYTNNIWYPEATFTLLDAILEMQAAGYDVPQVTFFMNGTDAGAVAYTMGSIVREYFSGENLEKYDSCWFRADEQMNPEQKPLLVGNWSNCYDTYKDQFWLKYIQWPGQQFIADAIPWMDWNVYQKNHNGVMNVSVAQGGVASSEAYFDPTADYRARGWTPERLLEHGSDEASVLAGDNFAYQWENVFAAGDEVNMVTVTGWNEWIVRKLTPDDPASSSSEHGVFVDSFNMAYSRDIEMMKGGYGDNYYMQLVENVRRFKGVTVGNSDNVYRSEQKTIDIADLGAWDAVTRKYLDLGVSTIARNHPSTDPALVYTDNSARNDIAYLKIANDGENLYVAVTCKGDISARGENDAAWMNLWLSCGGSGWEGYDFLIGRTAENGRAGVEALSADGSVQAKGQASFYCAGNTIVWAVPLALLGAEAGAVIGVKASDNLVPDEEGASPFDTDLFYTKGDCAPMGRLNYAYKIA